MKVSKLIEEDRDKFIKENLSFIHKVSSKICKKNLDWRNDDELSIALIAFNKACDSYTENKGDFFNYAYTIIKNALIDFFRKSSNVPFTIFNNSNLENHYIDYKNSLIHYDLEKEKQNITNEISSFSKELYKYKINFKDLYKYSPCHRNTRNNLLNIALICLKNKAILSQLKNKHLLPVTKISIVTNSKKKYIEKWRRYLITLIIALSNSKYPYIRSYLNLNTKENYMAHNNKNAIIENNKLKLNSFISE